MKWNKIESLYENGMELNNLNWMFENKGMEMNENDWNVSNLVWEQHRENVMESFYDNITIRLLF